MSSDGAIQRRKDALLAATKSADRQLNNIRDALADLNGYTEDRDGNAARAALRQAESSLRTIAQIADRWGAQP